ncbi:MAG: hypothetical protein GXP54_08640, partial [Deltaproteobacteria bacterium]|nr:hypothetical protein [Deltaproteobacteria bacterium]
MKRASKRLAVAAIAGLAFGCGSSITGNNDAYDLIDAGENDIPSAPIVKPVCDPSGLGPEGLAIPIDDFS